jgi:filamentous hemagglutinin family protein
MGSTLGELIVDGGNLADIASEEFGGGTPGTVTISAGKITYPAATLTQIQTDGTLPDIRSMDIDATGSGTTYQITEANGNTAGGNLFYSFSNFSIGNGDTAWFDLNSPGLANVVSRVTGGNASVIDGGLKMTNIGSNPSFFFINPAGITFNGNASVDVPGSFYASTASYLGFADGYRYNSNGSNTGTLSTSSPATFGFQGNETEALNIDSATLEFKPGTSAMFVGNSIAIEHATISNSAEIRPSMTEAGVDLQIVSTGSEIIDIELKTLSEQATGGDLTIDDSTIDVSGNGSGSIAIRADEIVATDSYLFANNEGNVSMPQKDGIDITAHTLYVDDTSITSDAMAAGRGGNVNITADESLTLVDTGRISASNDSDASGDAGQVTVSSNAIYIQDGGNILSDAWGSGNPGSVTVNAGLLVIDGKDTLFWTGISSNTGDETVSGDAGTVTVTAETLNLLNGGKIETSTYGTGNAGEVVVNAGQLLIDSGQDDQYRFSSIASLAGVGSTGDAGSVSVTADTLNILEGGQISSSTFSSGNAGTVSVNAREFLINGQGSELFTGIKSSSEYDSNFSLYGVDRGDAGDVNVTADTLYIVNSGEISSSTFSNGDAGVVTVNADELVIDGQNEQSFSGITSAAQVGLMSFEIVANQSGTHLIAYDPNGNAFPGLNCSFIDCAAAVADANSGNAGVVKVTADTITISNGGGISTSAYAKGDAGSVDISANTITIDGQGNPTFTGIASRSETGGSGDAGSVEVSATGNLNIVNGGSIDTSTFGAGSAGDVNVQAGTLSIEGTGGIPPESLGRYYAPSGTNPTGIFSIASDSSGGQTGSINITATDTINLTSGAQVSISNEATVAAPDSLRLSTISLSAPDITLIGSQIVADSGGNVDAGDITINFDNTLSLDPSAISTVANDGNGGDITINGGYLIYLRDSEIITSVLGTSGNGGDISITADYLIMDSGFIQANTAAEGATGGLVNVNVAALIPSGSLLYLGGDTPYQFQPYSGINVIQAAAPGGVSGAVNVTNPQLNLSGTLANLVIPAIDPSAMSRNMCAAGDDSSLTQTGKGGLRRRTKDALVTAEF